MSRKRYPLRVARAAHGIRAQDLRTLVRTTWWARRWIAALEAMRLGARLGRGRQYALSGQVTDLMLEGPHVEATVQGSRPEPYRVTLDFTSVQGKGVAEALRAEPMLLARLLTDDLPIDVEALLQRAGVPLFPKAEPLGKTEEGRPLFDVRMKCSCPDWARPCKHLVAVLFLLGEEIANHPATLLALRGIEVEDLVEDEAPAAAVAFPAIVSDDQRGGDIVAQTGEAAPFLKRLGPLPFWRGSSRCLEALGAIYGRVRPVAIEAAQGHSIDLR